MKIKKIKRINKEKLLILPKVALDTLRGRVATAISAALAFVIALSWNDAIKTGVNNLVQAAGLDGSEYIYSILTALLVTVIAIIGIYVVSKIGVKEK